MNHSLPAAIVLVTCLIGAGALLIPATSFAQTRGMVLAQLDDLDDWGDLGDPDSSVPSTDPPADDSIDPNNRGDLDEWGDLDDLGDLDSPAPSTDPTVDDSIDPHDSDTLGDLDNAASPPTSEAAPISSDTPEDDPFASLDSSPPAPSEISLQSTKDDSVRCQEGDVCREVLTGMPLRVLPRPFSHVYREATPDATIEYENVPAFHPLYVHRRLGMDYSDPADPQGWYRIGRSVHEPALGWMRAADVMEWRQALVVAYTHKGEGENARQSVLMFQDADQLKAIMNGDAPELEALALYRMLDDGEIPPGVISKEPEGFVDITQRFYMLPIIDFEQVDINGLDARYLRVAAALPGDRGPDTLDDREVREQLMADPGPGGEQTRSLGLNVVFVIDMTTSMQPYIDGTKRAVTELARTLVAEHEAAFSDRIRFGLVGFRDDVDTVPALEYTARNFTPELVDTETLVALLDSQARASLVSSRGYAEEVFAGVKTAIEDIAWQPDTLKVIVIIGDASSHPIDHPQNTTGLDAEALRRMARELQIHPLAMHLRDPKFVSDHPVAERQFKTLTRVQGTADTSALVSLDVSESGAFDAVIGPIAQRIAQRLADARSGQERRPGMQKSVAAEPSAGVQAFDKVFDAAMVEYLGKTSTPPKDITAWVLDRDLTDPYLEALEVRVLVTRAQLNDLHRALRTVLQAIRTTEITQGQFFDALQAVAAQTAKDPERIAKADILADTGLLPAFIESLPYHSRILSLDNERFAGLTAEQRIDLINRLQGRLELYQRLDSQGGWIRLNTSDTTAEEVYPLPLDDLP